MKQDTNKTEVLFLREKAEQDEPQTVTAYFPKLYWNKEIYKTTFTCYSHIGQHSSCHVDYANECEPATAEEYKDLKAELESIGYNLTILNR